MGWRYFRRSWSPDPVIEVYTDRPSVRALYHRIERMLGLVFLLELLLLAYEVGIMPALAPHVWRWSWPLWVVWAGLLIVLGYGFLKTRQKRKEGL